VEKRLASRAFGSGLAKRAHYALATFESSVFRNRNGGLPMKQYAIASLLLVSLTAPAFAARESTAMQEARDVAPNFSFVAKDHWAVDDTVGNCSGVDSKPSPYDISGLKILGDKSGSSSLSSAEQKIDSDKSVCKGTIQRA
jgi:hypothetical protein